MRYVHLATLLLALVPSACNDHTSPTPPEQVSRGPVRPAEYTYHGGPVEVLGEYAEVPNVAGLTSEKVKWGDGSSEITDTIDGPGIRVEHLYDDTGAVRKVLIERADSNLATQIIIDATGTVREIRTLSVSDPSMNKRGYTLTGWTFMLDQRGKVIRPKSGVSIADRIVRAVGE